MESLFERVTPRDDVLSGELTEASSRRALRKWSLARHRMTYGERGNVLRRHVPFGWLADPAE